MAGSDVSSSVPPRTVTRDSVGWWVDSMKAAPVGINQLNFTGSSDILQHAEALLDKVLCNC